ncbi:hypothetical protein [Vreelandella venusta]|uniref:hypothetical protein n=1 Tax=Vreelandella venusta TaxID=44935 RepID=UPI001168C4AB|nr:hypothetical protein [Halomonas venusta]GEK52317.1 hypothetical protein HVE01_30380 [Halomonas venusta]
MHIDWKAVSRSPGYQSLKAAYMQDVQESKKHQNPMRDKEEFLTKFRWVIGRAMHYAERQGRSIEEVLNEWEAKRDYWWLNFYQEGKQPKLSSGKPRNVKPIKPTTYVRSGGGHSRDPVRRFQSIRDTRRWIAREMRAHKGKKHRWPRYRKKRMAAIRGMK